jgi:predicted HicB family RNase H-like nuclease
MTRTGPPVYRGYEGSCIQGGRSGVFYGHVINVRESMIPFRFCRIADFKRALQAAVDSYLTDCRLAGLKPEKPLPESARERAEKRHFKGLLRKISAAPRQGLVGGPAR